MKTLDSIFERIDKMSDEVNVDAVFGEPREAGEHVLIPVAELQYGFGVGAGTAQGGESPEDADADVETSDDADEAACCEKSGGTAEGAGGGAGAKARPLATIIVGPDGVSVKAIMDEQKIALAGILLSAWAVGWLAVVLKTLFSPRK
jgi:uncharacterized spore protein YtfJ